MRNLDQDLFEQVQAQMEQPTFHDRASERMWKCEGLFAESKQNHCLARAKYRGRPKVQIRAYLCAIVQNLKRLLFPLYCWLLAHRWSYSTNTAIALPSNQSRPQPAAKSKTHSLFFNRPQLFAAPRSTPATRPEPPTRVPFFEYWANSRASNGEMLDGVGPNDHTCPGLALPR
jgi:hypothetical protein